MNSSMRNHPRYAMARSRACARAARIFIPAPGAWLFLFAAAGGGALGAADGAWTLRLEPMYAVAQGHDQHVLTIVDAQAGAPTEVHLDTDNSIAYRGGVDFRAGTWTWSADFLWFSTSQSTPNINVAASGAGNPVTFEAPDRSITAMAAGQTLFYRTLEDNDIIAYKLDFYGTRALAETSRVRLALQVGVTLADFDNDYRAAFGLEGVSGTRYDASSNYSWMPGPRVGLSATFGSATSSLRLALGQAVVFGRPDLTNQTRDFNGPFSDTVTFVTEEVFAVRERITIPITDVQVDWKYRFNERMAVGVGLAASFWSRVSVPPGTIPGPGGNAIADESTIIFGGVFGALEISF